MPKLVAQIDENTGEYVGNATAYDNPQAKIDGIPFNIPRGGIDDLENLPPHKDGFARIREGVLWVYKEDKRGQIMFSTADKSPKQIDFLGPVPEGYTLAIPGPFSVWKKTKWIVDEDAKAAAEREKNNNAIKAELANIDAASIRSIREWIMTQPNAPEFAEIHENEAKLLRSKLLK